MIVAVSDVHLGYEGCNKEAFSNFLDSDELKGVDHLVLLGDFFDFWRRNNSEIVSEHEDILEKLFNLEAKNMHYIAGNHDYYMFKLGERYRDNFPFTISKYLRLEDGGKTFYFIHGYEFEVMGMEPVTLDMYEEFCEKMCFSNDFIGSLAGHLWDIVQGNDLKNKLAKNPRLRLESLKETKNIYKLATSTGKSFLIGMKPDERLVFGHTHGPFINREKTVANTGSWVDELDSIEYQNSYVTITEGEMELKFFKP
jgi:UDP-2,3-diacylglucosamine pyrophosphatase LpxH